MTQKEKAIEILQQLDVAPLFIDRFANGKVTVFDNFIGYDVSECAELEAKIKEYERDHNCIVYAVTHGVFDFGECFSLLNVPRFEEDWPMLVSRISVNTYRVMSYVWNRSQEYCSEPGSIIICSFVGGICRVG